jgi:membrane complex biogenesis BtpA family protein
MPGSLFDNPCPVVGVVHLRPLPGSPGHEGNWGRVREAAHADARALAEAGVHGLLVENFGDAPFHPDRVPVETVSHITAVAAEIRRSFELPLGINVLRNDGCAALAVAHAVGADFVRINVFCGARVTDQGIVVGNAHQVMRLRQGLGAEGIRILADVRVKHSAPLGEYPLEQEVADTLARGGAHGIIVSGSGTGEPTAVEELRAVKKAAGAAPVWVGSGAAPSNLSRLRPLADGFIVGTDFKKDGVTTNPVDPERVRAFLNALS